MYMVRYASGKPDRNIVPSADAVFRCMGKNPSSEINEARKVCIDYTAAALKAVAPAAAKNDSWKFRFVYLSGGAAERDQTKSLWFAQEYRRMRVCSA